MEEQENAQNARDVLKQLGVPENYIRFMDAVSALKTPDEMTPEEKEERKQKAQEYLRKEFLKHFELDKMNEEEMKAELERINRKDSRLSRRRREALVAYFALFVDGPKILKAQEELEKKKAELEAQETPPETPATEVAENTTITEQSAAETNEHIFVAAEETVPENRPVFSGDITEQPEENK
jgi:hypothetical protein